MSSRTRDNIITSLLMVGSALGGAALTYGVNRYMLSKKAQRDPETDYSVAHELIWTSIRGAFASAMMYTGDRLDLYKVMREECKLSDTASVNAEELATATGYNKRWLREWLAHQASLGILKLMPGEVDDDLLRYRIPKATAEVLADSDSEEYDVCMIQLVPALVNRAKTMLPEAFKTGVGLPYNEPDVAEAIDRQHTREVKFTVIPKVLPKLLDGKVLEMLEKGCQVADLGCGAGCVMIQLAEAFPKSIFHGYEVSNVALEQAAFNIAASRRKNVFIHDATKPGQSLQDQKDYFDFCIIFDVLHDCTNPTDLINQVKVSLKPDKGVLLLADIPAKSSLRANINSPGSDTYFGFSTCLCMSCALSEDGGAGLGTLGFTIPVATKMLKDGGFKSVEVVHEDRKARWFLVQ